MMRRAAFAAILFLTSLVSLTPAHSATLTNHGVDGTPDFDVSQTDDRCTLTLSGPIIPGDAARFAQIITQLSPRLTRNPDILGRPRIATLCLDSPGGSLPEALRIAEEIRRDRGWQAEDPPFIITRLQAGARCESACALIFLAGTMGDWEGTPYPARTMHPTARLGIHAPALPLPAGANYRAEDVQAAYNISVEATADILRLLHLAEDPAGALYAGNTNWMAGSMLEALMRTPARSMRYIDTVDDAGRWQIGVAPLAAPRIDQDSVPFACLNTASWATGHPAEFGPLSFGFDLFADPVAPQEAYEVARYDFPVDELNALFCTVSVFDQGDFVLDATYPTRGAHRPLAFYAPTTPLTALVPTAAPAPDPTPAPAAFAPRYGGAKVTLWTHNGSLMAWESRGTQRWIWYYQPRPELAAAGVAPGTLLFDGTLQGGVLTGEARRFSARCGTITYPVSGPAQGTSVTLYGRYMARSPACADEGFRDDTLSFTYLRATP